MKLLIKNGTVINPGDRKITKADVLVTDGVISKVAPGLKDTADETYDAKGCYVMPGFIDLHVHLRDPGLEYKEDIQTGGAAALHGGFTTIVAMPNTKPVADKPDVINYVKHKAEAVTKVHVLQAGAVTKGQKGEELSDIRGMAAAGSPAISEDGKSGMNAQLYREGMKIAAEEGLPVTAEVCPHHFCMTSDDITEDDANYKMNPPLRTKEDVEALKKGLADDIMDVIATDHAPHAAREKEQGIQKAPFGIVGLETAAALTYTELVKPGILTPMQMAEKMSYNPAKVLGLKKGTVAEGSHADLTIFDPEYEWVIDPEEFLSKGKNTPFGGKKVIGKVMATIVDGEIAYREK